MQKNPSIRQTMLLINYESPDGYKRHNRLWNCGNGYGNVKLWRRKGFRWILIDDVQAAGVGCEYDCAESFNGNT